METSFLLLASAAALALSASAHASTVCSITGIAPPAQACAGFYDGNLLNGSLSNIVAQTNALASLRFAWDGNFSSVQSVSPLNGSHTVDFTTLLQGIRYVAFHLRQRSGRSGQRDRLLPARRRRRTRHHRPRLQRELQRYPVFDAGHCGA